MQINPLTRHDFALIGNITAAGFKDDPVNRWLFNGDAAMLPAFTNIARYCYLRHGFGHCTEDGRAGTLWLPPGQGERLGMIGTLKTTCSIARHGGLTAIKRLLTLQRLLGSRHPRQPHYYLFTIAVHPSLQGSGVGSQLLRVALEEADRRKQPAYLENTKQKNLAFYRKHGFEVLEEVNPGDGCPPLWLMWRAA